MIGNVINWLIAEIIMYIWAAIGMLLGLLWDWQTGLDGVLSVLDDFAFEEMGSTYNGNMSYQV